MKRKTRKTEPGNLLILGLGIWVFVMMLVLIIGASVHLHNERKDVLARADGVALKLAQEVSDAHYYAGNVSYDVSHIQSEAHRAVSNTQDWVSQPTGVSGNDIVVTLCRLVPVPFVPSFLDNLDEIEMCATSSARLRIEGGQ
ncbi:hypothetical protein [Arcanobacterium buesumense]|uniref:Uncharacterized protein n=1 Tax=Arcanobacterium buesumense TaxID=2722751 RepID=A0A6H2EM59_9ACTO|nr:hypothetical protein [Arcanobacterium buesumense]QJC22160.1 hypothetical protein HC352_06320 [Arcanobacterium buesumense]